MATSLCNFFESMDDGRLKEWLDTWQLIYATSLNQWTMDV
jgi:low affinity Fe/Cu permease